MPTLTIEEGAAALEPPGGSGARQHKEHTVRHLLTTVTMKIRTDTSGRLHLHISSAADKEALLQLELHSCGRRRLT